MTSRKSNSRALTRLANKENGELITKRVRNTKEKPLLKAPHCNVCMRIRRALIGDIDGFVIGTEEETRVSSQCKAHIAMFRAIIGRVTNCGWYGIIRFDKRDDGPGMSVYIVESKESSPNYWQKDIALVKQTYRGSFVGHGRILNSSWIDVKAIRRWKTDCDRFHRQDCKVSPVTSRLPPANVVWLVDTWRQCLTAAPHGARYVALSYVWGSQTFLTTTKEKLSDFQKHGAFSTQDLSRQIPRTIRDAMAFIPLLHERYLWVDALCIVQDDDDTCHELINNMCSVYAGAVLTIIAAQGKGAGHGLRGLPGISEPRKAYQKIFELPMGSKLIEPCKEEYENTAWQSRAWTFQEYIFSPRRITFLGEYIKWECNLACWHEDLDGDHPAMKFGMLEHILHDPLPKAFPDILGYGMLVEAYQERELTYQEDSLRAFAGITTALSYTFQGGFIHGLPVMFFDAALLWQPCGDIIRRWPSKPEKGCPPSWSWAGWSGPFYPGSWASAGDYIKRYRQNHWPGRTRTVPLVYWYSLATRDSVPELIDDQNQWYHYRTRYLPGVNSLPHGWKRYEYHIPGYTKNWTDIRLWPTNERPHYYYGHESVAGTEFWYPVPIANKERVLQSKSWGKLLSCQTQKARFWRSLNNHNAPDWDISGAKLVGRMNEDPPGAVALCDRAGNDAGYLRVHNEAQINNSIGATVNSPGVDNSYELVVISREFSHGHEAVEEFRPTNSMSFLWPKQLMEWGDHEFYNVLWVEWIDGIAYRKGLGRIYKEAWESQQREDVNLILG